MTEVAAEAYALISEPAGSTAPASSGDTYVSPGAMLRADINVVAAESATPVVMPAVIVNAPAVVLQNTARPIFTVVFTGTV